MKRTTDTVRSRDGRETITAEEFDRRFEAGEDISRFFDLAKARRPGRDIQRVNVDVPRGMLADIDREADRIGVTRQSWIKFVLADRLRRTA
jgi:hypothetical protein